MRRRRLTPEELARFDHVPEALTRDVRLVEVPVLAPGVDAMTLGHTVLMRRGHAASQRLLAHELVHVQQWSQLGAVGFLHRYLAAYFKNLAQLRNHHAAYLAIPLEEEARDRSRRWYEARRGPE